MIRDRQEKEQLVRKFEEILPFLKNVKTFGWYVPLCEADPVYKIYPDWSKPKEAPFRSFTVNIKTGWHSEVIYRDETGSHKLEEGISPIEVNDWSDACYRSNCVCKKEGN